MLNIELLIASIIIGSIRKSAPFKEFCIKKFKKCDKNITKRLDNSNLFSMELVGMQKSTVMVLNLNSDNMSTEQVISEATIRTVDKVFAKLQKEYDVFKPKSPLFQVEKKLCTAKIGMKEGLEGKEKFEVLEQGVNKEGRTVYKKILTILYFYS
jgi:hypothetical protein